jgi:hypothetical protein
MRAGQDQRWERYKQKDSGDYYYWNAVTGETTWETPPMWGAAQSSQPQTQSEAAQPSTTQLPLPPTSPTSPFPSAKRGLEQVKKAISAYAEECSSTLSNEGLQYTEGLPPLTPDTLWIASGSTTTSSSATASSSGGSRGSGNTSAVEEAPLRKMWTSFATKARLSFGDKTGDKTPGDAPDGRTGTDVGSAAASAASADEDIRGKGSAADGPVPTSVGSSSLSAPGASSGASHWKQMVDDKMKEGACVCACIVNPVHTQCHIVTSAVCVVYVCVRVRACVCLCACACACVRACACV